MQTVLTVVKAILLGAVVGILIGLVCGVAWAQGHAEPDPTVNMIAELLRTGGMPATLLWIGWRAAAALKDGIPVVVSLSADDRTALKRWVQTVAADDETRLAG